MLILIHTREKKSRWVQLLYKLLNNCIYGKSVENTRRRINVKLVNGRKAYQKTINKPNFTSQKIFDKALLLFIVQRKY